MADRRKMTCPKCGGEMNHHADKVVTPVDQDLELTDPDFGGVVQETHACPACATVEFRPAPRT